MRWEALAFTFISCIRQLAAQELEENIIYVLYAPTFCRRPTPEVGVFKQNLYPASIELVLV